MAGITISGTKNKATTKLLSYICSYMFEQQYGEMRNFTREEKEILENAKKFLQNTHK